MKVIHICESITGGISTYLNELLPHQAQLYGDKNVAILVSSEQKDELSINLENSFYFKKINRRSMSAQLSMSKSYIDAVNSFQPDVVHIHSTFAGIWFRIRLFFQSRTRYKFKVFYCSHGWSFDRRSGFLSTLLCKIIERIMSLVTDRIICISKHDYELALSNNICKQSKLVIIKNTINAPNTKFHYKSLPSDSCNFLFVGRFDKQKGFDTLISAFESITRKDVKIWCIGDFVVENKKTSTDDPRISILGWLPKEEVLGFMNQVDALLVPSRWEGFGLVALEALCVGCPVFHSGVGGLPEIHQECAFYQQITPSVELGLAELIENVQKTELKEAKEKLRQNYKFTYDMAALSQKLHLEYLKS